MLRFQSHRLFLFLGVLGIAWTFSAAVAAGTCDPEAKMALTPAKEVTFEKAGENQPVTIDNTGTKAIKIGAEAITLLGEAEFEFVSPPCEKVELAPGEQCTVLIECEKKGTGIYGVAANPGTLVASVALKCD